MYYRPSNTGGATVWDFAGTPGLADDSGVTGKSARTLFQKEMKQLRKNDIERSQPATGPSANSTS